MTHQTEGEGDKGGEVDRIIGTALFLKGKGIKRVPRKIEGFSGCIKGIGLPYKKE